MLPKISVITPSYNQGNFIEETILSVLGQDYPNLEYIIVDGGSTDNTVEIIKKYENKIHYWVSEKDNGQSHAINKGFSKASGDILCWLNSDDMYMPGTLKYIVQYLQLDKNSVYFGNCLHFKYINFSIESWGSDIIKSSQMSNLKNIDYIIQPSSFWTKEIWQRVGCLREDLHYAFDWEWFLRAQLLEVNFNPLPRCLSLYRIHDTHKTGTGGEARRKEILKIYRIYSPEFADLYYNIMNEDIKIKRMKNKFIRKFFHIINLSENSANVIKFSEKRKYQKYSINEIDNCIRML